MSSIIITGRLLTAGTLSMAVIPHDITPDAFSFTAVTGASVSTLYTSNTVTITGLGTGITAPVTIVSGAGQIRTAGGAWTTSGSIVNGQTLQVRLTTSASNNTTSTVVVQVGTVTAAYSVTTTSVPVDPYIANVVFLANFDSSINPQIGATPSTLSVSLVPEGYFGGAILITPVYNARYSTTSATYTPGTGNWTYEGRYYLNQIINGCKLVTFGNDMVSVSSSGSIFGDLAVADAGTVAAGQWFHFALVRNGNDILTFVNGQLTGTNTYLSSMGWTNLQIGSSTTYGGPMDGKIDDVRFTKGIARYTANFTPADYPNPAI